MSGIPPSKERRVVTPVPSPTPQSNPNQTLAPTTTSPPSLPTITQTTSNPGPIITTPIPSPTPKHKQSPTSSLSTTPSSPLTTTRTPTTRTPPSSIRAPTPETWKDLERWGRREEVVGWRVGGEEKQVAKEMKEFCTRMDMLMTKWENFQPPNERRHATALKSLETVLALLIGFTLTSFTVTFREEGDSREKTQHLFPYFFLQTAALFIFIFELAILLTWSDEEFSSRWTHNLKALVWLGLGCLLGGMGFYIRLRIRDELIERTFSYLFWIAAFILFTACVFVWKEKEHLRDGGGAYKVERGGGGGGATLLPLHGHTHTHPHTPISAPTSPALPPSDNLLIGGEGGEGGGWGGGGMRWLGKASSGVKNFWRRWGLIGGPRWEYEDGKTQ